MDNKTARQTFKVVGCNIETCHHQSPNFHSIPICQGIPKIFVDTIYGKLTGPITLYLSYGLC